MKSKTSFLILMFFIIFFENAFSQTPAIVRDWLAHMGSQDTVLKNPVVYDSNGNVFTAGFIKNEATDADIYLAKHANGGGFIWSRQYTGPGPNKDQATCLAVDDSNNVYVGGFTFSATTNNYDFILLKYNSSGTQKWSSTYNGTSSGYDVPSAILIDSSYVYITGACTDSSAGLDYKTIKYNKATGALLWVATYDYAQLDDVPFALSISEDIIVVTGGSQNNFFDWDYATIKYNTTTGAQVEERRDSGTANGFDRALAVKTDKNRNVYITGTYTSPSHSLDMKTIKLDSAGNLKWIGYYDYHGYPDIANDVIVDTLGNVYVCGQGEASLFVSDYDYILLKYDSSGSLVWNRHFDVSGKDDVAKKMTFDGLGNIVLTGESKTGSYYNFFTIAYSPDGDTLWQDSFDGTHHLDDKASDLVADAFRNIYVSGQSQTSDTTYEYVTIKYRTDYYISVPDSEASPGSCAYYPNTGQILNTDGESAGDIDYYTQSHYPKLYFTHGGVSFVFSHVDADTATADTLHRIGMSFYGQTKKEWEESIAYPINELKNNGYLNYFLPQCPDGIINVYGYGQLIYTNVLKEIDVEFSSNHSGAKFYFIIKPGGDPALPGLCFSGADSIRIVNNWGLELVSNIGSYEFDKPRVYQIDNGD